MALGAGCGRAPGFQENLWPLGVLGWPGDPPPVLLSKPAPGNTVFPGGSAGDGTVPMALGRAESWHRGGSPLNPCSPA